MKRCHEGAKLRIPELLHALEENHTKRSRKPESSSSSPTRSRTSGLEEELQDMEREFMQRLQSTPEKAQQVS
ncbi:hypothetical protein PFLUV_G00028300 [Perca fluviatilis]|uniref:Uncharacterized protein n=1 Tax=Perca fluviatilis TaxID=8168 RepID=A0A6A5FMN6_PERFL|nr:hypothetical protein PFLUV_G00028300 [Perca fluviatilis]